jgi:hypothetical protein
MITSLLLAIVTAKGVTVVKKIPVTEERRSIPATSGPVQGGSTQPVQPAQQQGPQTQQKVPLTPQQTPTK